MSVFIANFGTLLLLLFLFCHSMRSMGQELSMLWKKLIVCDK